MQNLELLFFASRARSRAINSPAQPTLRHYELSLAQLVVSRAQPDSRGKPQPIERDQPTFALRRALQGCTARDERGFLQIKLDRLNCTHAECLSLETGGSGASRRRPS